MSELKTVAVCATPFLPETASWLYHQISGLRRYRPVVLTQEVRNSAQFPVSVLHSAEELRPPMKWLNRLLRGVLRELLVHALLQRGVLHEHPVDALLQRGVVREALVGALPRHGVLRELK